jgi:hypothetical protein
LVVSTRCGTITRSGQPADVELRCEEKISNLQTTTPVIEAEDGAQDASARAKVVG